jgi:hypothetical protein
MEALFGRKTKPYGENEAAPPSGKSMVAATASNE